MKIIFCLSLLLSGFFSNSNYQYHDEGKNLILTQQTKDVREYTISGTFLLGSITYSYTIVVDATICVICNPPKITVHGVESLTICIQGTQICGSWNVSRIVHDSQDNLEYIEFSVDDIEHAAAIESHVNDETFQQIIKDQLLNQH